MGQSVLSFNIYCYLVNPPGVHRIGCDKARVAKNIRANLPMKQSETMGVLYTNKIISTVTFKIAFLLGY